MRSQPLLVLAPLSALLLGGLAHASGGPVEWNRRAVQVAGIAQPDGSTLLHAAVQTQLFTPSTAPRDLSMNVEFRVNGAPLGTVFVPQLATGGGTCPAATYDTCGTTTFGPAGCALDVATSSAGVCSASGLASLSVPAGKIQTGDVVTAHLTPAAGALPELDLSDDATAASDGAVDGNDFLLWQRNFSPSAQQSAAGDGFLDIRVDIDFQASGAAVLDLSASIDVEVGGVVVASQTAQSMDDDSHKEWIIIYSVPVSIGDEIMVILRPAPGALPELPGFEAGAAPVPILVGDLGALSVSAGGTQKLALSAGAAHAGELYLVLGSLSGTAPGLPIGTYVLPLNAGPYFFYTVNHANQAPLFQTLGVLDAAGHASAAFQLGFASPPSLSGLTLHHAALLLDPVFAKPTGVTNAVKLKLL